jgi:hypothetical protein
MPRPPNQMCRCCDGLGLVQTWNRPYTAVICETCLGSGRVTIPAARALNWRPIRHTRRVPVAVQTSIPLVVIAFPSLFGGEGNNSGDSADPAGLCNTLQDTSNLRSGVR